MRVFAGTSGWAYKAWQPQFYPEKLPQSKYLAHYASCLNTVEVNYTFRHLLTEKTIDNWLKQTPKDFQFALKANQAITHIKRLKNVDEALGKFLAAIAPLEQSRQLGPVLFQLPPNAKASPEVLDQFLGMLPRSLRPAFEFRHESWFQDEVYDVLRRHRAALCIAETEDFVTPEVHTAPFAYYRFRCSDYSRNARRQLAERVWQASRDGREVFAYFKHEEAPDSPLWALELLNSVQTQAA